MRSLSLQPECFYALTKLYVSYEKFRLNPSNPHEMAAPIVTPSAIKPAIEESYSIKTGPLPIEYSFSISNMYHRLRFTHSKVKVGKRPLYKKEGG